MDEEEARKKLEGEGFSTLYVIDDPPGRVYGDHTHENLTAHIILEGEMELTVESKAETCKKGDRVDVPANTVHSAKIGPDGCRYLVGE